MPAVSPDNTKRFYVHYNVSSLAHTLVVRTEDAVDDAAVSAVVDGIWTDLDANLYEVNTITMEVSLRGSNVRNPATWGGGSSYGSGTAIDSLTRAQAIVFTGRDPLGHAVRSFFYGAKGISDGDYRTSLGENSAVDNAITTLQSLTTTFLTIGGGVPVWHNYANITIPIHWQKKLRTL